MRASIATASTGNAPIADSADSITASVPSRIALATSVASARVGRLELTIDSSICVAVITGSAEHVGAADEVLLHHRDPLDRDLDAEVAARDHDAVGGVEDLVEALEGAGALDLGDDERRGAERGRRGAHRPDVVPRCRRTTG